MEGATMADQGRNTRFKTWATRVLLLLASGCAFWTERHQGEPSMEAPRATPAPASPPALYQTVTTTLTGDHANERASALTWNWRYDVDGRPIEVLGPGTATRIAYASHPPAGPTVPGDRRVYVRDARGRLLRAESSTGSIEFDHGLDGTLRAVESEGAPRLRYNADAFGRLTNMQIGEQAAIQYRYDYLGRLAAVGTPAGDITYTYQPVSNTVVRRLPNGVKTIRTLDDEGLLVQLTHLDPRDYVIAAYSYRYRP